MTEEPKAVTEARRTIREWELRNGHRVGWIPLGEGGYQGRCWDCSWRGPKHLRSDSEEMGSEESRRHKKAARRDAAEHREQTRPREETP